MSLFLPEPDGFEMLFRQLESMAPGILSSDERMMIREKMRERRFRRRQYFLQEGEMCRYMGFVVAGAARIFSVDERGLEHTMGLWVEGDWIVEDESFYLQKASGYHIEMLEDSQVLLLSHADHGTLVAQSSLVREALRVAELGRHFACRLRLHRTISQSAQERYDSFHRSHPGLIHRFPQTMIASFLGVSAETLCRVRRQRKWQAS